MYEITFSNYQPQFATDFKNLNLEWIAKYFTVEEHDVEQLSNPQEYIIDKGGEVLFALLNGKVIGTCALIKTSETEFEMAKMAISPNYRGLQIGYKLGEYFKEKAKAMGAKRIWLESNRVLTPAISLYNKLGFKEIPIDYSPYTRADIRMELWIDETKKSENMILRKAVFSEQPIIWEILQQAIEQRKRDGSQQWQNGYPNEQSILDDISNNYGYVLVDNHTIIAYAAIIFGVEPAYNNIEGKWLTSGDYVVIHRVATSNTVKGKGIATRLFKMIEDLCLEQKVYSIKVDTNFDNIPMMKILDRLDYTYCGEIFSHGALRKAYEKIIPNP
jgi:GNAT superfamily N-acetyltransferase